MFTTGTAEEAKQRLEATSPELCGCAAVRVTGLLYSFIYFAELRALAHPWQAHNHHAASSALLIYSLLPVWCIYTSNLTSKWLKFDMKLSVS